MIRSALGTLVLLALALGATAVRAQASVDGGALYQARCAVCHQRDGSGITAPPTFPPVDALPGRIAAAGPEGRRALLDVVLFGLQGELEVDGIRYSYGQEMPGWRNLLSDEEVAALVGYLLRSWDNPRAVPGDSPTVTSRDVAQERRRGLSPQDVHALWRAAMP